MSHDVASPRSVGSWAGWWRRREPIRGVTVRAASQVGGYAGSGQGGSASVACDDQGRFEIPAIAAGMLTLELEFDPEKGRRCAAWRRAPRPRPAGRPR